MSTQHLQRRLGLADAVVIGLGSMIGAGVFAVWGPAARVAGDGLLIGLGIALVAAYANATSSAQLAAQYPTSGGTYVYGREQLGEWPGFLAGWGFVIGKTASVAAMAVTLASAIMPGVPFVGELEPQIPRTFAVITVLAVTAINLRGVTRTVAATRVILAITLPALALVVFNLWHGMLIYWSADPEPPSHIAVTPYGVLQSAGLLFFAFAGYARIATMGEEVRDPERTIPRAIVLALGGAALVYAVIGVSLVRLGTNLVAHSGGAPLQLAGFAYTGWIIVFATVAATAGAMLNLLTGIGRTSLAMARNGDLPTVLARVDERHSVPRTAEIIVACVVCALILIGDIRTVIGFSSFGVLLYYTVANIAAFTQHAEHRRYPKALQVLGAVVCLVLVATLPWQSIVGGLVMYAVGIGVRLILRARR